MLIEAKGLSFRELRIYFVLSALYQFPLQTRIRGRLEWLTAYARTWHLDCLWEAKPTETNKSNHDQAGYNNSEDEASGFHINSVVLDNH